MIDHERQVDKEIDAIAKQIADFALSLKPDIGFDDDNVDLTYCICLAVKAVQEDADLAYDILSECYMRDSDAV